MRGVMFSMTGGGRWASLLVLMLLLAPASSLRAATGVAVPELAAYDTEIQAFMARWNVPGAAVAVVRQGRLVLARGYGVADPVSGALVQPDSRFRVASVSKPMTAAAVMKLVEDGGLTLDLKVFPYLDRGPITDPRLAQITVRHLLEHSGGWDRDQVGDPMFRPVQIAQAMGVASPPDADTVLRWMLTQPLQFEPGTRYAYSNFGYLVLGQVLAKASGQRYEDAVRTLLLKAGITGARLGASLPAGRLPGEVRYTMPAGQPLVPSVFAGTPASVPWPDGGFALEAMAAHGGWVASAVDLVAFAAAVDGQSSRADLFSAASRQESARRPAFAAANAAAWYAKGWMVNTSGHWWHTGSLPGTTALLVSASNGTAWAVLMNTRSETQSSAMSLDLDNTMWAAYGQVRAWPVADQFANHQPGGPQAGCFGEPAFAAGVLCLPVVEVPDGQGGSARYTATLQLVDPAGLQFDLAAAAPADSTATGVPAFDAATGRVNIPRVLLPDVSGRPAAYRVELSLVPGAPGLRFRVSAAVPL